MAEFKQNYFQKRTKPRGPRSNNRITSSEVQVITSDGDNLGILNVNDAIKICYNASKLNKCRHYSISNKKIYKIVQVAKLFSKDIIYLPKRSGERYASALTKMNLSNKVYRKFGKIDLENYINNFLKSFKNE